MIVKVLSYKDTKLNNFTTPIYLDGDRADEDIIEICRRMAASGSLPASYWEFDVYVLGTFDDKLGVFNTFTPVYLCSFADFKHLKPIEKVEEASDVVQN